jgi:hypothetical protein
LGVLIFPHYVTDRFLQSIQSQFKHGENLSDLTDASRIWPFLCKNRIDPGSMGEGVGDKL